MGFSFMLNVFPFMFGIVFFIAVGSFVVTAVRGIGEWNKNNNSPRLTVAAAVVAKRQHISHSHHANAGDVSGAHGYHTSTDTKYYVTFQVESGDRLEFSVSGSEYGMLAEGDQGELSFQGSRYQSFNRGY